MGWGNGEWSSDDETSVGPEMDCSHLDLRPQAWLFNQVPRIGLRDKP